MILNTSIYCCLVRKKNIFIFVGYDIINMFTYFGHVFIFPLMIIQSSIYKNILLIFTMSTLVLYLTHHQLQIHLTQYKKADYSFTNHTKVYAIVKVFFCKTHKPHSWKKTHLNKIKVVITLFNVGYCFII